MENHCAEIADYISSRPVKNGRDIGYRMSKAALLSQTVTLAQDLQEEGENIVAVFIYPGYLACYETEYVPLKERHDGVYERREKYH